MNDLRHGVAGERVGEDQLVLGDETGLGVDVEGHLLSIGHGEGDDVMLAVVEAILAQVTQAGGAVERLAQDEVGQSAIVLHELLLARLRRRHRRHRASPQVVSATLSVLEDDDVVPLEAASGGLLLEEQAILRQIEYEDLAELTRGARRLRRRHLQARHRLALELEPEALDRLQRLGAADGLDRGVQDLARAGLGTLRQSLGVRGRGRQSGNEHH